MRYIEQIKKIRAQTGCPYWAIYKCLEMYDGDEEKAVSKLESIYAWYHIAGDNPDKTLRNNEAMLLKEYEEYEKYIRSKTESVVCDK